MKNFALFVLVCLLCACGKGGDKSELVEIEIKDSPNQATLRVPKGYLSGSAKGVISIKTIYPEMTMLGEDERSKFYKDDGTWSPSLLRIFVSKAGNEDVLDRLKKQLKENGRDFPVDNYRFVESKKSASKYVSLVRPSDILFVLYSDENRVSIVRCGKSEFCTGRTSIGERLTIEYQLSRDLEGKFSDVDLAIHELVESFLIADKKGS